MPVPRTEHVRYRRFRPAVKVARARARDVARRWDLDELADDLETIIGELVANAVVHGRATRGSRVTVTYRLINQRLMVEVRDWATGVVNIQQPADPDEGFEEGGRGLAIVSALSYRWGVIPRVIGKTVWCELEATRSG